MSLTKNKPSFVQPEENRKRKFTTFNKNFVCTYERDSKVITKVTCYVLRNDHCFLGSFSNKKYFLSAQHEFAFQKAQI